MNSDKNERDLKQWLPHLLAGTSVALSLYTLYKQNRMNETSKGKRITSKSKEFVIPDSDSNRAVLSRVMLPDDANPGGNVHGGTILKMIGHAGWLGANRYLQTHSNNNSNNNNNEEVTNVAVIVRMEGMTFKEPMFIGEVANVDARVTYTANHSAEVQVHVYAENIRDNVRRLTNTARLWFVSMSVPTRYGLYSILRNRKNSNGNNNIYENNLKLIKMPPLEYYSLDGNNSEKEGSIRYKEQKERRKQENQFSQLIENFELTEWVDRSLASREYDQNRPAPTVSILSQVSLPSDCFSGDIIDGGTIMKMMDNCAGTVAARWCRTSVVTIAIDSINFLTSIHSGEIIHTYGRLVYTSKRSLEILVLTFREGRTTWTKQNIINNNNRNIDTRKKSLSQSKNPGIYDRLELACTAFFTFVSIGRDKETNKPRAIEVPQIIPVTTIEKSLYNEGKIRYNARKAKRKLKLPQKQNININTNTNTNTNEEAKDTESSVVVDESENIGQKYKPTVIVGPSGVGKGTLLEILIKRFPNIFSKAVSHTTRKSRDGEINGVHYYFTTRELFETDIKKGNFIEYADVHGNYYGTSKMALQTVAKNNQICLLEIDYQGAINIKKLSKNYDGKYGKILNNNNNNEFIEANYIFITCPNGLDTLKKRLKGRNTETDAKIEKRLETAKKEFEFFQNNKDFFDFILVNDDLNESSTKLINKFIEWYPYIDTK